MPICPSESQIMIMYKWTTVLFIVAENLFDDDDDEQQQQKKFNGIWYTSLFGLLEHFMHRIKVSNRKRFLIRNLKLKWNVRMKKKIICFRSQPWPKWLVLMIDSYETWIKFDDHNTHTKKKTKRGWILLNWNNLVDDNQWVVLLIQQREKERERAIEWEKGRNDDCRWWWSHLSIVVYRCQTWWWW